MKNFGKTLKGQLQYFAFVSCDAPPMTMASVSMDVSRRVPLRGALSIDWC